LNCHEIWEYDDQNHIQKLASFIALCDLCHYVKHIGLAGILAIKGELDYERVVEHFMKVNGCDRETFEEHRQKAFDQWHERSRYEWNVDLGEYERLVEPGQRSSQPTFVQLRITAGALANCFTQLAARKRSQMEMSMSQDVSREQFILRDLGDGLILQRATVADTEALAAFNAEVHFDRDTQDPDEGVAACTRDLMAGDHPTSVAGDFTVVEDTHSGAIVSSLCLISQRWSYGGIEFGVGRPDLVGTHPDFRRRGLVRAQFEVIHQWSAQRGQKMQAITGSPWFYRQFGYEMALELGGGRVGYMPHVPKLKDGEAEPYGVRPATEADLPFIAQVYEHATKRSPVACVRNEALWRYELHGRSEKSVNRSELRVVESAEGETVGFLAHPPHLWGPRLVVTLYELKRGVSWLAVTPSVIRYLQTTGKAYAVQGEKKESGAFAFWLGTEHPVYQVIHKRLPDTQPPYAWYVRVPDVPDFLRHVAPVLERRLAKSALVGHTGELKISFYRDGLHLVLENGRLTTVEQWAPTEDDQGAAKFSDRTFLQLLFGYRALEELEYAFADCGAGTDEARALLKALFAKQASNLWPVG